MSAATAHVTLRDLVLLIELELFARTCLETERPSTVYEECCEAIAHAKTVWQLDHPTRLEVRP